MKCILIDVVSIRDYMFWDTGELPSWRRERQARESVVRDANPACHVQVVSVLGWQFAGRIKMGQLQKPELDDYIDINVDASAEM